MDTVAVVAAETGKVAMKQDVWRDPMVVATFLLVVATFLLVLIALKQHRTSHDQIRVDLFDKRHRIFRVLMDLIRKIGGGEPIGNAETWDFLDCRNEAVFLFTGDRDMEEYLKDFFHNLKTLACCYAQLNAPTESERQSAQRERDRLFKWFTEQGGGLARKVFGKYLEFKK